MQCCAAYSPDAYKLPLSMQPEMNAFVYVCCSCSRLLRSLTSIHFFAVICSRTLLESLFVGDFEAIEVIAVSL